MNSRGQVFCILDSIYWDVMSIILTEIIIFIINIIIITIIIIKFIYLARKILA